MTITITKKSSLSSLLRLTYLALFFCFISSCKTEPSKISYPQGYELYPTATIEVGNQTIPVLVAKTDQEKAKGLSSIEASAWPLNQGMLFYYSDSELKSFWMPDTYFSLDIIYLNSSNKVIHIDENVPFHPGYTEPPKIWRGKSYYSQHILELRSNHPYKIKVGDKLNINF